MADFFQNITTEFLVEIASPVQDNVGGGKSTEKKKAEIKDLPVDKLSPTNLGLTDRSEYDRLRSPTLKENSAAKLDERQEIRRYLVDQPHTFLEELDNYNEKIARPMEKECRVVVTIPAFQEGGNIRKTLDLFTHQTRKDGIPLDPKQFEVLVVDNHKESTPPDGTEEEIAKFVLENPDIRVSYAHKKWRSFEPACVGNARKYASDLALYRSMLRPQQDGDLILISFDADVDGLSSNYISNYVDAFDKNDTLDAIAGKWNTPAEVRQKPTLHATQRLWYILDRVIQKDAFSEQEDKDPNIPSLIGRNAAHTASIYAAIGGYNPYAKCGEDLEIGWMIADARQGDKSRFAYLNTVEVVTNPRRFLASFVQETPLIDMYSDFHENESLRSLKNQDLLNLIPNNFDQKRFEKEAATLWERYVPWNVGWLPKEKMQRYFTYALFLTGVEAKFTGDETHPLIITNTERLQRNLAKLTIDTADINTLLKMAKQYEELESEKRVAHIQQELQAV